jgi:hypothetical protein
MNLRRLARPCHDLRLLVLRCLALCIAAAAGLSSPALAQTFTPNEAQASPQPDLFDYEFSQRRGALTWNDSDGKLWLAWIDRATGMIFPPNGKGMLLDPDSMKRDDAQLTKNGPEFAYAAGGDVIVTTKFNTSRHIARNARISITAPLTPSSSCTYISADGLWCTNYLDANHVRIAPYGSNVDDDPAPRISYVDDYGNHYWREVFNPSTERPIVGMPPSNFPVRHVVCNDPTKPGVRGVVYPIDDGTGTDQVFYSNFDVNVPVQLTFDAGNKYEVWMWCAPEFGNELVFYTLVDNTELRIYRNLPDGPGDPRPWKPVLSYQAPPKHKMWSPEPFVYNGRSFIFMSHTVRPLAIRTEIWIASADPANPLYRLITPTDPVVQRTDPEVFVTDRGPLIYYNRFTPDAQTGTSPRSCRDPQCSHGVWFADPGLKDWVEQLGVAPRR